MNTAPKYSKIELLLKSNQNARRVPNESLDLNTTRIEFEDAGLIITGDYIVIVENDIDPEQPQINTGRIFPLSEIVAYRTYKS